MPRRELPPRSIDAADLNAGRVDPNYRRVVSRLLAAHAMAEKLTALGYQRAIDQSENAPLRSTLEKNFREERKHARLLYRALQDIGIAEQQADRSMIAVVKAPSFEAPMKFAQDARGELDVLMASLALDVTGMLMIGVNYRESSYTPHARAAEIILEEEADHENFALEQLGDAAARLGADRVNKALNQWLPLAVNFFGPPGSGFTFDCLRYGLKSRDNAELAELYLEMLGRRCDQLGLKLPALTPGYPRAIARRRRAAKG